MRMTFCVWEGDPAVLVHPGDGRILGYEFLQGTWRRGSAPEIATKASVIDERTFKRIFPKVPELSPKTEPLASDLSA